MRERDRKKETARNERKEEDERGDVKKGKSRGKWSLDCESSRLKKDSRVVIHVIKVTSSFHMV